MAVVLQSQGIRVLELMHLAAPGIVRARVVHDVGEELKKLGDVGERFVGGSVGQSALTIVEVDVVDLAALLLLKVEALIVKIQDVAHQLLRGKGQGRKVGVHHEAVGDFVDLDVALHVVGRVRHLKLRRAASVPGKLQLELRGKDHSVSLVVGPKVVPEVGCHQGRDLE